MWRIPARMTRSARCSPAWPTSCIARPLPARPRSCGNLQRRSVRRDDAHHGTSELQSSPRSSGSGNLRLLTRGAGQRWSCMPGGGGSFRLRLSVRDCGLGRRRYHKTQIQVSGSGSSGAFVTKHLNTASSKNHFFFGRGGDAGRVSARTQPDLMAASSQGCIATGVVDGTDL